MAPKNLAILVHDDVEVLDFCGPFEAFGVTGDDGQAHFNVFTVADEAVAECMMYRWAPEDEARAEALIAS